MSQEGHFRTPPKKCLAPECWTATCTVGQCDLRREKPRLIVAAITFYTRPNPWRKLRRLLKYVDLLAAQGGFYCTEGGVSVIVGVPKETKLDEYRVSMLPVGVEELNRAGHTVLVQREAGVGSGLPDELYLESRRQTGRHRGRSFLRRRHDREGEGAAARRKSKCAARGRRCSPTSISPPIANSPKRF